MSFFSCPNCQHISHVFGKDGVTAMAKRLAVDALVDVPLETAVCELSDQGKPIVIAQPDSLHAQVYHELARLVWAKL